MAILEAKELIRGGWHYTIQYDGKTIAPIGYCREHAPHATREEAEQCYAQYLVDTAEWKQLDTTSVAHTTYKCERCELQATWKVILNPVYSLTGFHLCDHHKGEFGVDFIDWTVTYTE